MHRFGLIVFALSIGAIYAWEALNPEEALFGYTRCMEIYLDNVDPTKSDKREATFQKWKSWDLRKDNDNTECYALCVLQRLELFDGKSFKPERVDIQYNAYKDVTQATKEDKDALKAVIQKMADISNPNCNNVYDVIMSDIPGLKASKKIYHGDISLTAAIYEKNPDIRQKKQSYFEYCEKKYYGDESDKPTLCKIRKYEVIEDGGKFAKHTECIFKGLRYFNRNGEYNKTEIERDFRLANQESQISALSSCDGSSDSPISVYKCLVSDKNSNLFKAFQEAFDYREIRTRDYSHRIKNPEYVKDEISSDVSTIDSSICTSRR